MLDNFPIPKKSLSGALSECQMVWIQISFLTVRKGYQQTTTVATMLAGKELINTQGKLLQVVSGAL